MTAPHMVPQAMAVPVTGVPVMAALVMVVPATVVLTGTRDREIRISRTCSGALVHLGLGLREEAETKSTIRMTRSPDILMQPGIISETEATKRQEMSLMR